MPKSNKSLSKLNYVSSKISQLQQELRELQRMYVWHHQIWLIVAVGKDKARKKNFKHTPRDMIQIPKPKGSAGRNPPKGYNLQTEMGLGDNKRRYNNYQVHKTFLYHIRWWMLVQKAVRKLADEYLNTNKTMKDQKKLEVCKVITIVRTISISFRCIYALISIIL